MKNHQQHSMFLYKKLAAQLLLILMLLCLSPSLLAKCEKLDPPDIPEDAEISAEEMAEINEGVNAYMTSAKSYLDCTRRKKKRNAAIDEMRVVAADYNVLIQFYREYEESQATSE